MLDLFKKCFRNKRMSNLYWLAECERMSVILIGVLLGGRIA